MYKSLSRLFAGPNWALAFFGALFIVFVVGGFLIDLKVRHDAAIDRAEETTENFSKVLAEHTARTFEGVDRVMRETELIRERYNDNRESALAAKEALQHLQKTSPIVIAIGWSDAAGDMQVHSYERAPPRANIADLSYFAAHRDNKETGLIIAPPFLSVATGNWITTASRRLNNADGSFAGIISVVLDPSYFASVYRSIKLGRNGSVTLLHRDKGMVLVREPFNKSAIGRSVASGPLMSKYLPQSPAGSYHAVSVVDGTERVLGYHTVPDLPLVVLATYDQADVLEGWRHHIYLFAPIVAAFVLIIGVGTILLIRRTRHLAQKTAILSLTLDHMAHGLCMFDAEKRLMVCNKRYAQLYGVTPELSRPGTPFERILEARAVSSNAPEGERAYVAKYLANVARREAYHATDRFQDGRYITITHEPIEGGGWVAIHQDATEQKRMERELVKSTDALKASNERFRIALQNMSQGLCMFDATQKVVVVNQRYREIYELPEEMTAPGTPLSAILEYRAAQGNFCDGSPAEYVKSRLDDATEIQHLGNGRVVLILRHKMADGSWLTTHEDITERHSNEARVAFMAHHDALTGLPNRAALAERIGDACARYRRLGETFNVFMLDLDRFKHVNDTFGHPAGDALLQQVAERLKSTLRETDVLARLGGDEFAIVQAATKDQREAAQSLANRIIARIGEAFAIEGNSVSVGTSIGIALAPEHGIDADGLLKMADLALYQTKSKGRNDYTFFEAALNDAATARQVLETDLRRAIAKNEFELHFQPIHDLKSHTTLCVEALLRWRNPQKGMILPAQFIPLAEECGMIGPIGEWVLSAACREAASWPAPAKVSVNVSPVELCSSGFVDRVMCVLVDCGLPPERLELEITEAALFERSAECLSILRQLKNLGVTVALDDFGTGYSSLSQLTMFPFDRIKIDRSFVQNMTRRADCAAIIAAVLALAHSLDITTTAEGVETPEQLRLLAMAGVSSVQGHLIKRPGPAAELIFETPNYQEMEDAA